MVFRPYKGYLDLIKWVREYTVYLKMGCSVLLRGMGVPCLCKEVDQLDPGVIGRLSIIV